MYVLSKTNYQDFENNVECFKMLKEAQAAMKSYYKEDKNAVGVLDGDGDETANGVTLLINDYCALVRCEEFYMEYQIYDFSNPIDASKTAK